MFTSWTGGDAISQLIESMSDKIFVTDVLNVNLQKSNGGNLALTVFLTTQVSVSRTMTGGEKKIHIYSCLTVASSTIRTSGSGKSLRFYLNVWFIFFLLLGILVCKRCHYAHNKHLVSGSLYLESGCQPS